MNIKNERDDFAYIGSNDIQGYDKFQQLFDHYNNS